MDQSKGLEFDSVLIADPGAMLRESPRGGSDLYVAVTRATRRLGIIADGSLPDVLHRMGGRRTAGPDPAHLIARNPNLI